MPTLLSLIIGGVLLTIGDIVFKFWIERSEPYVSFLYAGGLFLYMLGAIFLIETYKTENIATATAIFIIVNIVTLALVSWLYFHDNLTCLQMIGLMLAICSIVLIEIGK